MTLKTIDVLIWPVLILSMGAVQVQVNDTGQRTPIPKPATKKLIVNRNFAKNLIVNGDFAKGSTGFQTGL